MILNRYCCTINELLETCKKSNFLNSIFTSPNFISNGNNLISEVCPSCIVYTHKLANYDSKGKMLKIEVFLVMFNCSVANKTCVLLSITCLLYIYEYAQF